MADVRYYKMRGRDVDCLPILPPTYRTWTVQGSPDPTGALYATSPNSGAKCGLSALTDIAVAATWIEPGAATDVALHVDDLAQLRSVIVTDRGDGQTRFVKSKKRFYGNCALEGAGVPDDADNLIKPDDVLEADPDRWYGLGGGASVSAPYLLNGPDGSGQLTNAVDVTDMGALLSFVANASSAAAAVEVKRVKAGSTLEDVLDIVRALPSGGANSGIGANVRFRMTDGAGVIGTGAAIRAKSTGIGAGVTAALILATAIGGTLNDRVTVSGSGSVRVHALAEGVGHFDANGNLTSSAVVNADLAGPIEATKLDGVFGSVPVLTNAGFDSVDASTVSLGATYTDAVTIGRTGITTTIYGSVVFADASEAVQIASTTVYAADRFLELNHSDLAVVPAPTQIAGFGVNRGSADGATYRDFAAFAWMESASAFGAFLNTGGDQATIGAGVPIRASAFDRLSAGQLLFGTSVATSLLFAPVNGVSTFQGPGVFRTDAIGTTKTDALTLRNAELSTVGVQTQYSGSVVWEGHVRVSGSDKLMRARALLVPRTSGALDLLFEYDLGSGTYSHAFSYTTSTPGQFVSGIRSYQIAADASFFFDSNNGGMFQDGGTGAVQIKNREGTLLLYSDEDTAFQTGGANTRLTMDAGGDLMSVLFTETRLIQLTSTPVADTWGASVEIDCDAGMVHRLVATATSSCAVTAKNVRQGGFLFLSVQQNTAATIDFDPGDFEHDSFLNSALGTTTNQRTNYFFGVSATGRLTPIAVMSNVTIP